MTEALTPISRAVPEKPTVDGIEERWLQVWDQEATYRFDRTALRTSVYSIDTPPPTVSGLLHIGHIFSFTQIDLMARYWRMRGKDVFFPMGWDDNGLPTERRVENYFGVRCDPSLAYDPGFTPPQKAPEKKLSISRKNFVELCHQLTRIDEEVFKTHLALLGPEHRLEPGVLDHLACDPGHLPARIPRSTKARRGLLERRAHALGR
jgi:valyl-tRNA synthetase